METQKKIPNVTRATIESGSYSVNLTKLLAEADQKQAETKTARRIAIIMACIGNGINSLAEITDVSKLSRSTVHRLLKGMEKTLLIIHDPSKKRYYLGSLIRYLVTTPDITHQYLVNVARMEMARLGTATDETVILSVKIGLNHVTLLTIPSTSDLQVVVPRKNVGEIFSGASSKVLLSQLSDKELKDTLDNLQFQMAGKTMKEDLIDSVKKIQHQGYAVTSGERLFGATMISAPILGYNTPAALGVIGPDVRILPKLNSFIQKTMTAANNISRMLVED